MNLLYNHLSVNSDGHLAIGGLDTLARAREFGTPAYIMDEDTVIIPFSSLKNEGREDVLRQIGIMTGVRMSK